MEPIILRHEVLRALRATKPKGGLQTSRELACWTTVVQELAREMYPDGVYSDWKAQRDTFLNEAFK